MLTHYHLYPKDAVDVDAKGLALARGAHPRIWHPGDPSWWKEPDAEGNVEWHGATGIFVMKTRKFRRCDQCKAEINCKWVWRYKKKRLTYSRTLITVNTRHYVQQDTYVGISGFLSCELGYWGADWHICLKCARKMFEGHYVYKCSEEFYGDGNGRFKVGESYQPEGERILFTSLIP